jgi:hypothetical protein
MHGLRACRYRSPALKERDPRQRARAARAGAGRPRPEPRSDGAMDRERLNEQLVAEVVATVRGALKKTARERTPSPGGQSLRGRFQAEIEQANHGVVSGRCVPGRRKHAMIDLELVAVTQVSWCCVGGPRKDAPLPAGKCRCKACPALNPQGLSRTLCGTGLVLFPSSSDRGIATPSPWGREARSPGWTGETSRGRNAVTCKGRSPLGGGSMGLQPDDRPHGL